MTPYILIGLGNPGPKYHWTRHNIGFLAIDTFLEKYGKKARHQKHHHAVTYFIDDHEPSVLLVKPMTYMNKSGLSLAHLEKAYPQSHFVIITDDYYLPYGEIRVKSRGGHGGHNGLRSIIGTLGEDFIRVRCGIQAQLREMDSPLGDLMFDYVLAPFSEEQQKHLPAYTLHISECLLSIIREGVDVASNRYNKKIWLTP